MTFFLICTAAVIAVVLALLFTARISDRIGVDPLHLLVGVAVVALGGVIVAGVLLPQAQRAQSEAMTETTVIELAELDDERSGTYLSAEYYLLRRVFQFQYAEADGWIRTTTVPFDGTEVREADVATLTTKTNTHPRGWLWPVDQATVTYALTVPAGGLVGAVLTDTRH